MWKIIVIKKEFEKRIWKKNLKKEFEKRIWKKNLNLHIQRLHRNEKHIFVVINAVKVFQLIANWKVILSTLTVGINPPSKWKNYFCCDQCGKGFSFKSKLKGHIEQSHTVGKSSIEIKKIIFVVINAVKVFQLKVNWKVILSNLTVGKSCQNRRWWL